MGNSLLQTVYTGDSIVVAAATMVHGFQIAWAKEVVSEWGALVLLKAATAASVAHLGGSGGMPPPGKF